MAEASEGQTDGNGNEGEEVIVNNAITSHVQSEIKAGAPSCRGLVDRTVQARGCEFKSPSSRKRPLAREGSESSFAKTTCLLVHSQTLAQEEDDPVSNDDNFPVSFVDTIPDCPVCLQVCLHPVQLPCGHIFCFLCVKGVTARSQRCALCRRDLPFEYFDKPTVVKVNSDVSTENSDDVYKWYYEGRNGWWQYDERASSQLEDSFNKGKRSCELLIAGFLYVVDIANMFQYRRSNPSRRRRIKRDRENAEKKGIAGLKLLTDPPPLSSHMKVDEHTSSTVSCASGEDGDHDGDEDGVHGKEGAANSDNVCPPVDSPDANTT